MRGDEKQQKTKSISDELVGWTLGDEIQVVVGFDYATIYDFPQQRVYQIDKWTGRLLTFLAKQHQDDLCILLQKAAFSSEKCTNLVTFLRRLKSLNILVPKNKVTGKSRKAHFPGRFPNIPSLAEIEITSHCNFNCPHCYFGAELNTTKMSFSLLSHLIDEVYEAGIRHIQFTGGEPFTRTDLLSILKKASGAGLEVELLSNGSLIKSSQIPYLKKYVNQIQITLYGMSAATYQHFVKRPNTFEKIIDSIRKIRAMEIPFHLAFTITSLNFHDVNRFVGFCQQNQIKFLLGGTLPVGKAQSHPEIVTILKKDLDRIIEKYIDDNGGITLMDRACRTERVVVLSDGRVTLCPLTRSAPYIAGNAHDDTLLQIWRTGCRNISEGQRVDVLMTCKNCELKYICTGGCPIIRVSINTRYPCALYFDKKRFLLTNVK